MRCSGSNISTKVETPHPSPLYTFPFPPPPKKLNEHLLNSWKGAQLFLFLFLFRFRSLQLVRQSVNHSARPLYQFTAVKYCAFSNEGKEKRKNKKKRCSTHTSQPFLHRWSSDTTCLTTVTLAFECSLLPHIHTLFVFQSPWIYSPVSQKREKRAGGRRLSKDGDEGKIATGSKR